MVMASMEKLWGPFQENIFALITWQLDFAIN